MPAVSGRPSTPLPVGQDKPACPLLEEGVQRACLHALGLDCMTRVVTSAASRDSLQVQTTHPHIIERTPSNKRGT